MASIEFEDFEDVSTSCNTCQDCGKSLIFGAMWSHDGSDDWSVSQSTDEIMAYTDSEEVCPKKGEPIVVPVVQTSSHSTKRMPILNIFINGCKESN